MTKLPALLALILFAGPPVSYLKYQRPVQASSKGQNYFVVDDTIWRHARHDLPDLRLFAGETETPYALVTARGGLQSQPKTLAVLQQSTVAGKTQFLVDTSGLAEYDHVKLNLATRNFVAHATVDGQDDPHGKTWAALGSSTLYDLSRENLGANSVLRFPRSKYKYLRVTVDSAIKPEEVTGATTEVGDDQQPQWRDVGKAPRQERLGKDTVLTFDVDANVPVERVLFTVDPSQANFRREVEVQNEKGGWLGSGEIDRVHMVRAGQKIDSEHNDIAAAYYGQKTIKVIIHDGDDRPLKLTDVRLQQLEQRLYFDAPGPGQFTLYYGDDKLGFPVYDYAKLFAQDKAATPAGLGAEVPNADYRNRADDRPWSERHPAVLWTAIIAAVAVLGAVALRSVRAAG